MLDEKRERAGPALAADAEAWIYFAAAGEQGHRFIVVPVRGHCLEPRIADGYRVVADKDASPRPGDIVVAEHEGEFVVKILEEREGEWWLVAMRGQPPIRVNHTTRIEGVVR